MLKKSILPVLVLLSTFAFQAQAKKEITMLVVPRDAKAIQIARDISHRYPVLLVSYLQEKDLLKLHAWNGESWIEISTEDYVNGAFFENQPGHAILIESANAPAPELLIPDGIWCDSGNRLVSTEPHVMIHLLGTYFDFPYLTWKKFSRRYGEPIARINPALINMYLWNTYGEDLWDKRDALDAEADMDKWLFLDITPPPPVEPVVIEEEPVAVEPAEIPATEPVESAIEEVVADEPVLAAKDAIELPEPVAVETPAADAEPVVDIINALEPAAGIDPFSAKEIPAAEIVLPEAK
ncbi:MAG: hypothetical protein JEZ10_03250 [Verrucomicrobia bacterium]|nr:hypothetical protein [Verrucomicrobiota bacterium]